MPPAPSSVHVSLADNIRQSHVPGTQRDENATQLPDRQYCVFRAHDAAAQGKKPPQGVW